MYRYDGDDTENQNYMTCAYLTLPQKSSLNAGPSVIPADSDGGWSQSKLASSTEPGVGQT